MQLNQYVTFAFCLPFHAIFWFSVSLSNAPIARWFLERSAMIANKTKLTQLDAANDAVYTELLTQ